MIRLAQTAAWFGLVLLLAAPAPLTWAGDDDVPGVVLRSGRVFRGRVTGKEKLGETRMVHIETDLGDVWVPVSAVKKTRKTGKVAANATFDPRVVHVCRIEGTVERKRPPETTWTAIRLGDRYGLETNLPNGLLKPGDRVRTGADGTIELVVHAKVWTRVLPESEVHILAPETAGSENASLTLDRGRTVLDVRGRPRGTTFRLRTPLSSIAVSERAKLLVESGQGRGRVAVGEGAVDVEGRARVEAGNATSWTHETVETTDASDADRKALAARALVPPRRDMVFIPDGTYRVLAGTGSRRHDATLSGFLVDRHEVSWRDVWTFLAVTSDEGGGEAPSDVDGRLPANVKWEQAAAFARWAGKSLPTEAQWEAAAFGETPRLYPWGNAPPKKAWKLRLSTDCGRPVDEPFVSVDAKTPDVSLFGVRSMASNMAEWCRDWYVVVPSRLGVTVDPTGPEKGDTRVVRGFAGFDGRVSTGGLHDSALGARARSGVVPRCTNGFRCVIELAD